MYFLFTENVKSDTILGSLLQLTCLNMADGLESIRGPFQPQLLHESVKQITSYYLGNNHREFGLPLMKTLVLVVQTAGWKA